MGHGPCRERTVVDRATMQPFLGWSEGIIHSATLVLNLGDQILPLLKFQVDEINSLLEDDAFTAALPLQSRHQFCETIEALPNRRPAFLLGGNVVVLLLLVGQTRFLLFLSRGRLGCGRWGRGGPVIIAVGVHRALGMEALGLMGGGWEVVEAAWFRSRRREDIVRGG